ncbi:hypothetical protein BDW75DRAFT_57447 [Aspergillus navahoensis]
MAASIYCLSPELISMIADCLGSDDLFNFRLCVQYFRNSSLRLFTNRFFRKRIHLLAPHSLLALLDISQHHQFSASIHTVIIAPDHLTPSGPYLPPSWNWDPDCQVANKQGYKRYLNEQMYYQFAGLYTAYLTQILKNTRNCRTLILDDRYWPWGAAHIKRETGCYPSSNARSDYSKTFFKQAVHVLIAAMTASGIPILDLAITTQLEGIHVQPNILHFPTPYLNHAPWVTALASLQLTVDPGYGQEPIAWSKPLADFIMLFPHLDCLDLYFDTRVEQPAFHALSKLLSLPHLRVLHIGGVDCLPEDLLGIFVTHRSSLREISLDVVGLSTRTGGSWRALLAALRENLQLTRFEMVQCDVDGHEILFEDNNNRTSNEMDSSGEDSRLLDDVILSIKEVIP